MRNFTKRPIKYTYHKAMRTSDILLILIVICLILLVWYAFSFPSEVKANKEGSTSIQEILSLDGCRVTQDEDSHMIKGNGSMYAVDISCESQRFWAYAPKFKDVYVVKLIGYDTRLGNYVVLKHGDYELVFAHTVGFSNYEGYELKKGDRVRPGDVIGLIDKSGMFTGYHLHFELWKYGYNISYRHLLGEKEKYNMGKTYALRKQRGWYLGEKEAMDFVSDFEGFRENPYVDGDGRLSIGYGTRAKGPKDHVTKEEAKQRIMYHIEKLMESVYKNHFVKYHNQRIALVSATYNLGINSSITNVKNRKTDKGVKQRFGKYVKGSICDKDGCETKKLGGLVKRRNIEANLYLNK